MRDEQNKDGRVPSEPGSREPSPEGLGPSGFDPSRDDRDPYWDYDESECWNCSGEGFVYGCSWDWQCDTYDEGEGTCLCTRACHVCRPRKLDPELQQVLASALHDSGSRAQHQAAEERLGPEGGRAAEGIAQTLSPSNPEKLSVVERVTDALAVAAGTPGFGSDMGVWSELASTVLEAASEILSLQERLDKLEGASEDLCLSAERVDRKYGHYADGSACDWTEWVNLREGCQQIRSALSPQTREGDK